MEEVVKVKVVRPYVLRVHFSDGKVREVDVKGELTGEVFKPLKNAKFFAKAAVNGGIVAWANGADFAPEFLYHDAKTVAKA